MTVLVVEQKLPFVRRVCDRFCIMDKGRIVGTGAMPELTDDLVENLSLGVTDGSAAASSDALVGLAYSHPARRLGSA